MFSNGSRSRAVRIEPDIDQKRGLTVKLCSVGGPFARALSQRRVDKFEALEFTRLRAAPEIRLIAAS
jgi:hypothetical protein